MVKFSCYILMCFLLLGEVLAQTSNLPDLVDSSSSVISPEMERRLGKAVVRNIRKHAKVVSDPEIESYIESIGYKLVANSDNNNLSFSFFVIDSPDINAFAVPGGSIGINSGVILNSQSESELAAVLAHEIAHVTQRHIARAFEKRGQSGLPTAAVLFGSILLSILDPKLGAAVMTVATSAQLQTKINFTRTNEKEADSVGMQLLARTGYDPQGMPGFFERLQKTSSSYNTPEFLRTHPLTLSRISESKDRASSYPETEHVNTMSYELMRAKLEVDNYDHSADAVAAFEKRLSASFPKISHVTRYGYAIALTRAHEYKLAGEQLEILLEQDENNVNYMIAAARAVLAEQDSEAAFSMFRHAYRLYPDYRPLVVAYARGLLANKQPEKSRYLLRHYGRQRDLGPLYYDLLSQADSQSGEMVEAAMSKSKYFYLTGDTQAAMEQLIQAQQDQQLSERQQETVVSRISELEYELELEAKLKI